MAVYAHWSPTDSYASAITYLSLIRVVVTPLVSIAIKFFGLEKYMY